jgi:hypothetical protein
LAIQVLREKEATDDGLLAIEKRARRRIFKIEALQSDFQKTNERLMRRNYARVVDSMGRVYDLG